MVDVIISALKISQPYLGKPSFWDGLRTTFYDIQIQAHNQSDKRRYVTSQMRSWLWDASTKLLTIHLTEGETESRPGIRMGSRVLAPIPTFSLDPGAREILTVTLPRFLKRLVSGPAGVGVEVTDLTESVSMKVVIGVGNTPTPTIRSDDDNSTRLKKQQKWLRLLAVQQMVAFERHESLSPL